MANRKRRQAVHTQTPRNAGETCYICKVGLNRTSRLVLLNDTVKVKVCKPCINRNSLVVVGK